MWHKTELSHLPVDATNTGMDHLCGEICENLRFDSQIMLYVFCRLERDSEHEHKVYMTEIGSRRENQRSVTFNWVDA